MGDDLVAYIQQQQQNACVKKPYGHTHTHTESIALQKQLFCSFLDSGLTALLLLQRNRFLLFFALDGEKLLGLQRQG